MFLNNPLLERDQENINMHSKDKEIEKLQKRVRKLEAALKIVTHHSGKTESQMRKQFEVIAETIPVPLLILNEAGEIYFANLNAQKTYGYSAETFFELNASALYHSPEDRKRFVKTLLDKGEVNGFRTDLKKSDGSVFPAILFSRRFDFDGQPSHLTVVHDLTELIALEKQLQQAHKMESIGTLAGGIAHDFNNILSIILGNTELVLDDTPDWNPAHHNIQQIKTASLRAKDVIRQLLSFSRKTEQEQKPMDISPVLKESLKLIKSSLPSSIEIRENIPDFCHTILADTTQIHQVLINLCTNAAQAMSENGGVLEIAVNTFNRETNIEGEFDNLPAGNYLELIVKDTGSGIDAKTVEKIFDPYFTTKEVGKGTGMGLAVVHGIIKNHNGYIYVNSAIRKGTCFTIFFPIVADPPEPKSCTIVDTYPQGTETILFVDDEEDIVEIVAQVLTKLGYKVEAFTSPAKALEMFKANPDDFDLVISDMTMPQMSGKILSNKIKALRSDIPIIICTGYSSLMDEKESKIAGISAYAMKPVSMTEMSKLIREILDS